MNPASIQTQNGNPVACPWILSQNTFKNTPLNSSATLTGKPLDYDFVPNLSSRYYLPGYGFNQCINDKPMHIKPKTHINFFDPNNYEVESVSKCYSQRDYDQNGQPTDKYVINKCYDPLA